MGQQFIDFKNKNIDSECLNECPLECDSIEYDFTLTHSNFPNKNFYDLFSMLNLDLTYEKFTENSLSLNVYYSALSYIKLTETPTTSIIDLFSGIGGLLGLFAGISILSFIEIVELTIELIYIFI
jgi:hypothetical protein